MRAIYFDGDTALFVRNYYKPEPQPGESLVRVELTAISHSDEEAMQGHRPYYRGVMGHEFVGIVEASPDNFLISRRVVGEINISCGSCLYCMTGREQHCKKRQTLGINGKDGSFADYLTLPTRLLWPVSPGLRPEQAVYTEPLAAALEIVSQLRFTPNYQVAIVGDGRMALMVAQALSASTACKLTVFGRHPEKLALFSTFCQTLMIDEAFDEARKSGFEIVVDASGDPASLPQSLALTRSRGTLVVKSNFANLTEISISDVVSREIRIQGSSSGPFAPALQLLEKGYVRPPAPAIYKPEDYQAAFRSTAFKTAFDFRL